MNYLGLKQGMQLYARGVLYVSKMANGDKGK